RRRASQLASAAFLRDRRSCRRAGDGARRPAGEHRPARVRDRGRPRMNSQGSGSAAIRATYRLQFHNGFTFRDAEALVAYLARLGISHVYASPLMEARPGSTHGYDIVNHNRLNPEIGAED